jgi:predicted glutamine amidotransferase
MCRLLGVVARTPANLHSQLTREMPLFIGLSTEHGHGWGIGHRAADGHVVVQKEPVRAADSAEFREAVGATVSDMALLHIRQASPGMPLTMANTHPFAAEGLAFAHNGYAWPTEALDHLLAQTGAPLPFGDTDSERYLSLVRAGVRDHPRPQALRHAAGLITGRASMTSLNCLMLTREALYAMAWWHAPTIRSQPDGETERDYRLWYRIEPERVVVASAGMQDAGANWQELPDRCVLEVRQGTLETVVHRPG